MGRTLQRVWAIASCGYMKRFCFVPSVAGFARYLAARFARMSLGIASFFA
jgi:hypothetical protein